MKKIILFLIINIVFIFNLYAQALLSIDTFFNDKEIEKVLKGEIITRMYIKDNASGENTDLKIDIPNTKYTNEVFSNYEVIVDEKAFVPYKMEDVPSRLKFYNVLTAYSKLKGMQYYTRMRKRKETFILESSKIDPKNNSSIPDEIYNEIKPKIENYFTQKDNKFGKLTFKSELYNDGNVFVTINTCTHPTSYGIVSINKKNETKFISYFFYNEEKKGFYYYSINIMRVRVNFVLKKNDLMTLNPTLFSNRLRATTIHLAKMLGLNWEDKLNPWDEDQLEKGAYKNY